MKNQSGTIKTNLELYKVVMGGSGGYGGLRWLQETPRRKCSFFVTDRKTDRHTCILIYISSSSKCRLRRATPQILWSPRHSSTCADRPRLVPVNTKSQCNDRYKDHLYGQLTRPRLAFIQSHANVWQLSRRSYLLMIGHYIAYFCSSPDSTRSQLWGNRPGHDRLAMWFLFPF